MRLFIQGDDELFTQLEQRAQGICVRYKAQEMPPGSVPDSSDIGFEIDTATGQSTLYVSRGIQYMGGSDPVSNWLLYGSRQFESFDALKTWIQTELAIAFNMGCSAAEPALTPDRQSHAHQVPGTLTDFNAVHAALARTIQHAPPDEGRLFHELTSKVIGQDFALKELCATVTRHCARTHPSRPAVIFATGPTGVGKTKTALALSDALRNQTTEDTRYHFLRLDMAEYQEPHRISQLIGAPQGYAGHGDGSQLVDALLAHPHTIVLFDEIEKAHSSILRVLMNAMDAGRLSTALRTGNGHEVDCKHAIFIFTSNLMSPEIIDELTTRNAFTNQAVINAICRSQFQVAGLLPEIIGRIGKFLIFLPLEATDLVRILTLEITEIAKEYGIDVQYVAPETVILLMRHTHSHNLGARPARYLIDDLLGGAFTHAVHAGINSPVAVVGDPLRCVPLDILAIPSEGGTQQNTKDNIVQSG